MAEFNKTFTVKEVAALLGLSEFTVRRRIKEGTLKATIDSKKQGFRVSEESLLEYANAQNSKVGSLWQKSASIGAVVAGVGSQIAKSLPSSALVSIGALAGIGIGKILSKLTSANSSSRKTTQNGLEYVEAAELNNPMILDKIIERLQVEMDDYDLKIEYQKLKMKHLEADSDRYFAEQEVLFQLKAQKSMVRKEMKDLEIRKALLEQS